ncbi:MAG: thioredoxin family protein [Cetobacterium sp.]|uniref:thioredoxin family protein n=1 Tax=unclassified Cetobacterium TaxID=2630983 RepID=UPI00163CCD22|nr:thioredoxin family protein [Cetobacterium sp. 2A]MBC2856930.1 thioredoxin family protein [Cetobacterium sp. 2A]
MNFKELFEVGVNFDTFVGTGSKSERDRIPKNYSRVIFSEEFIKSIRNYDKKINFLISAEMWCFDAQLNSTVVKKICELNSNFDLKVITKGRGEKFVKPLLEIDNFKIPTILVLDENFELLGMFIEKPETVKLENFEDIKMDYLKGAYLKDTASQIGNIILNR